MQLQVRTNLKCSLIGIFRRRCSNCCEQISQTGTFIIIDTGTVYQLQWQVVDGDTGSLLVTGADSRLGHCETISYRSGQQMGTLGVYQLQGQVIDGDIGNLVHPFMSITNQMTRRLTTLRQPQLLRPFTGAQACLSSDLPCCILKLFHTSYF